MTLPDQIREQIEAATKLREQAYNPAPAEKQPESTEVPPSETAPEAVAAPAAESREQDGNHEKSATPVEDENSQTYAQRWRSLQGVHNSTLQRINSLEQLITQMQAAPAPAPAMRAPEVAKFVTEKDESDYGSDMVDFARRVTREEMNPVLQALGAMQRQLENLNGLAPAVQQVAVKQQASAEEKFFDALGSRVPDWASINDNPQFHNWLLSEDAMTGIKRQTYLMDAQDKLDLARVVSIFNSWKREAGVPSQAAAAPAPTVKPAASKLEQQVAPGRSNASSAAPAQKAEKRWTGNDIKQFYVDKRNGVFKGREAEAAAMERDIFQAQKQGRMALS